MRFLFLVISLATIISCQDNNSETRAAAKAAAIQMANQPAVSPDAIHPDAGELILMFKDQKVQSGSEVCLPVYAEGFNGLLSMQYTIQWDPKVLKFLRTDDYKLPYLNEANFGINRVEKGLLPTVWIDNALNGVTIPVNKPLFEVCYTVIGKAGSSTVVHFGNEPTPHEVVNLAEQVMRLKDQGGSIIVE